MDKYHAYSAYKDVGLHWVSSIPEHWSFTRNIALFEERESKNHPEKELLAVTIAYGVVKQAELAELTERKNTASDDKTNYKLVKPGDLAYNKMRMWQGAIGISPYEGIVSPAYVILKAKATIDPRYFHYQFKTPGFISEAGRYSYGLCDDMNSLRFKDFKTLYSVHPPLKEQCAIADFLDHETAKIDHLIAKQERLIELLKEKRHAVISHAVRAGGNSQPAKLGYFTDLLPGYAFPSASFSHDKNDIPLLRGINVDVGSVRWEETVYWPKEGYDELYRYALFPGDLVFGMDRPWIAGGARVAEITTSDVPSLLLQRVCRLRARKGLTQKFLKLILSSQEFKAPRQNLWVAPA